MPPPPPVLMEELVEEILLRLPPDDPACLIHVALVCKQWCRLVSSPGFRRRFREFHRTAPMLGLLCNLLEDHRDYDTTVRYVPTATGGPPPRAMASRRRPSSSVLDARHGRVLVLDTTMPGPGFSLVVWDVFTDGQQGVELPPVLNRRWARASSWNAAVLCAGSAACDHFDCHGGHFSVVVLLGGTTPTQQRHGCVCIYSSETGTWTALLVDDRHGSSHVLYPCGPSLLIGDALHFPLSGGRRILKCDLGRHGLSVMSTPWSSSTECMKLMTSMDDGGLGVVAHVVDSCSLYTWSWKDDGNSTDGSGWWEQGRVIELDKMMMMQLSIDISNNHLNNRTFLLVGFVEGLDTILISVGDSVVIVALELKSGLLKKVYEKLGQYLICSSVPYVSFYTPDIAIGRFLPPESDEAAH